MKKVAVLQTQHRNGDVGTNIRDSIELIDEAAKEGARLVLLPELVTSGFMFVSDAWDFGEPLFYGPTHSSFSSAAIRLGIWIAYTILESRVIHLRNKEPEKVEEEGKTGSGENSIKSFPFLSEKEKGSVSCGRECQTECEGHFYNTFVLISPDGQIQTCSKTIPAALESYVFSPSPFSHVFETEEFGRIGVAICYENLLTEHNRLLAQGEIDLLLAPHSAPVTRVGRTWSAANRDRMNNLIRTTANRQSALHGVPTLFANKVGPFHAPCPPEFWSIPVWHDFNGFSKICDGDGNEVAVAEEAIPCVIVAEIEIQPGQRRRSVEAVLNDLGRFGRFTTDLPFPLTYVWPYIMEPWGRRRYRWAQIKRNEKVHAAFARRSTLPPFSDAVVPASSSSSIWWVVALGIGVLAFYYRQRMLKGQQV